MGPVAGLLYLSEKSLTGEKSEEFDLREEFNIKYKNQKS